MTTDFVTIWIPLGSLSVAAFGIFAGMVSSRRADARAASAEERARVANAEALEREKETRHQGLLDQAERWLPKFDECAGMGFKALDTMARLRDANAEPVNIGEVQRLSALRARQIEAKWDYRGPILPADDLTDAINECVTAVRNLHQEALTGTVESLNAAFNKVFPKTPEIRKMIAHRRGTW